MIPNRRVYQIALFAGPGTCGRIDSRILHCLPSNMTVGGDLDLNRRIEELPDGFALSVSLDLIGCKKLTRLPANLFVNRDLLLGNEDTFRRSCSLYDTHRPVMCH